MYDLWRADGTKREGMEKEVFRGTSISSGTFCVANGREVTRPLAGEMTFTESWEEDSGLEASASLSFLPFTYCLSVRAMM